jgi:beta-glucuronidase
MFRTPLYCILILLPVWVSAQQLINNVQNRNITSLNGKWNYIVDPYETGYLNFHSEVYDKVNPTASSAFYNNYHAKNKSELVEYDFDKSPVIKVPGDWNTQKENLYYYEGTVWYKKSFDCNINKDKRYLLYFGAVNYKADVYLNGTKLGMHEGGFTPFSFEISSVVKPKDNFLIIRVDNRRSKDGVPTLNTDWWNYGGITRDVLLIEETAVFIQNFSIQLDKGKNKALAGFVQLSNAVKGETLSISIPELKVDQIITTADDGRARFTFEVSSNITYWSPETPKLYSVTITSSLQTLKDEIGFRTIETKGPDILLNGKPIFLRGISIHEDYRGRRANGDEDAIAMLNSVKELGCNYVRLAHYPHNESMLRMADKMGLLVWEEIPVYWTINFQNEATYNNAKNQLTEVITRDRNRASVIIWSVANETPKSDIRNTFLRNLIDYTRTMDNTRLVSAALLTRWENGVDRVDDAIGEYLDIVAFNEYRGWYGGDLKTAPDAKWVIAFNKPAIVSEFGGDAKQGLHGDKEERWTEEYQEYLYIQNLAMIEKMPNIRGTSPWILMDFRSPRRLLPGIQDEFNRKGLISDRGEKKKAFFVLQEFYKKIGLRYR